MTAWHYSQSFCFTALTVGVGATGSVEIGGAFDTSGNVIAYNGQCLGGDLSDEFASIDGSIVVGFWNELGSIPGHSHTIGTSFGAEEGKDFSFLFFNLKNIYYNTTILSDRFKYKIEQNFHNYLFSHVIWKLLSFWPPVFKHYQNI